MNLRFLHGFVSRHCFSNVAFFLLLHSRSVRPSVCVSGHQHPHLVRRSKIVVGFATEDACSDGHCMVESVVVTRGGMFSRGANEDEFFVLPCTLGCIS